MKKGAKAKDLVLSPLQTAMEIARPWILLCTYIFLAQQHIWWLAVPAAFGTMMAGFVQMHDAVHNALKLPKRQQSLLLSLSALLLLKSGHALQVTHLRHHAQSLSDNDPEGAPAHWTLSKVFINGAYHAFMLRMAALRIAPKTKRIQLTETAATLLLLVGAILLYVYYGNMIGLVYWAMAFVLSVLMPLWASYIPHKMASKNPMRLAGVKLAQIWTPLISTFAFHHLHHAYPTVPTALLPKAATELPEPDEHEH